MSSGTCADLTMFSGTQRQARSKSPHCSRLAKGTCASCYAALLTLSAHLSLLSAGLLLEPRGSPSRDCLYSTRHEEGLSRPLAEELQRWDPFAARMCTRVCGTAWEHILLRTGPKMPKERGWVPFPTSVQLQQSLESSPARAAQPRAAVPAVRAAHPVRGCRHPLVLLTACTDKAL